MITHNEFISGVQRPIDVVVINKTEGVKMINLQYTHAEMVKITDDAKRDVILDIEQRVEKNFGQKLNNFTLISRESVLKDIEIVRMDNGL